MSEGSLTSVEARQNLSRVVPAEIADVFGHPLVLSTGDSSVWPTRFFGLAKEHGNKAPRRRRRRARGKIQHCERFVA